ncbi:TetR/AcrR family transcriptional regulator [Paracoccus sp. Z330]|uniref:TetR/AcrR family transcriptional regulator n=1 Tax=Paracoccus onchidii TaxID=3017813 RepID=A0ABT4ZAY7_9RHOB|nr:TetR/AcrR family transcriptional regulator [Paracoccus onchidii]MDB6176108.1 TetR/AcrR family transcriptional regulator [Paracoccus onchidii]
MTPKKPHHHGNLQEALIDAGLALLAESGQAGLTLRKTAARAGVSHSAPAHHFDGLRGLLNAIAKRGFEMLLDYLRNVEHQNGNHDQPDPFKRLMVRVHAYLDFCDRNEPLFRLMFTEASYDDPELQKIALNCYQVLRDSCRPFTEGRNALEVEHAVWTMAHGFAVLGMNSPRPNAPAPNPPCEDMMRMLLLGPSNDTPD